MGLLRINSALGLLTELTNLLVEDPVSRAMTLSFPPELVPTPISKLRAGQPAMWQWPFATLPDTETLQGQGEALLLCLQAQRENIPLTLLQSWIGLLLHRGTKMEKGQ